MFSGLGQGAHFTGLDWVGNQCRDKLGFRPFPGTLNLRTDRGAARALRQAAGKRGVEIVPPSPEFCPARALKVDLGGEVGAVIIPQAKGFTADQHGEDVIEVIAPASLKKRLTLRDGDRVTLRYDLEA